MNTMISCIRQHHTFLMAGVARGGALIGMLKFGTAVLSAPSE